MAEWFRVNQEILVFRENDGVTRYLGDDLRPFLERGMGLAFPLISMDRLIGLVFLRLGQALLDGPQLATLRTLGRQAGLAFENALMFKERLYQNERMCRAEQLAVMGQFAAGVAHELRNPLTTIRSTMQFLAEEFAAGSEQRKLAETMLEEVDRLNGIVGNLLSFGRPTESKPVAVDLRGELDKCVTFIEARARHQKVRLETACAEQLPRLLIDPAELRQVLVNIMINGLQAMPEGGTLHLRVQYPYEASRTALPEKDRILIEVCDDGPGVPEALRERVFEPFFTTKPGGTGLGLPICRSIVRRYGGEIWIEGADAGGTSVKILLPGE
jgi:signal transduction histidine kinase